jgi:hypothetical protein
MQHSNRFSVVAPQDITKGNWAVVPRLSGSYNTHRPLNAMIVSYYTKKNDKTRSLTIRLTPDIVKKLGWQDGEYIVLSYDLDDVNSCFLIKNSSGHKLSQDKGLSIKYPKYQLTIKTDFPIVNEYKSKAVKFMIDGANRLFFRMDTFEE